PECARTWRAGQHVAVRAPVGESSAPPAWTDAVLLAADAEPASPRAIEERFRLRGAAAASLDRPRAVAIAALTSRGRDTDGSSASNVAPGPTLEARFKIGERRALSLLPGLGRLDEEKP